MKKIILTLIFIFSFLNADISQYFPKLEGRVIDQVNLLSAPVKKDINKILENHEKETSNQIVVVILDTLNGYPIEDYSYQLGRDWGIGQKDKNNGVLLVIAMQEKKIRIEVGYGLEGALTDKISNEIIEYSIKPNFKANQYELGILKAINEIMQVIKGEYTPKNKLSDFDLKNQEFFALLFFWIIFVSIFINSISKRFKSQFLYKSSKSTLLASFFSFFGFFIAQALTPQYILITAIIFIVIFLISFLSSKNVDFDRLQKNNDFNSSSSGGFGGFGSSSGGFSGGGGSFGGGGASGGW